MPSNHVDKIAALTERVAALESHTGLVTDPVIQAEVAELETAVFDDSQAQTPSEPTPSDVPVTDTPEAPVPAVDQTAGTESIDQTA